MEVIGTYGAFENFEDQPFIETSSHVNWSV